MAKLVTEPTNINLVTYLKNKSADIANALNENYEKVALIAKNIETKRGIDPLAMQVCGTENNAVLFPIEGSVLDYTWLGRYEGLVIFCKTKKFAKELSAMFPKFNILVIPTVSDKGLVKKITPAKKAEKLAKKIQAELDKIDG